MIMPMYTHLLSFLSFLLLICIHDVKGVQKWNIHERFVAVYDSDKISWADARDWCILRNTELASLHTVQDTQDAYDAVLGLDLGTIDETIEFFGWIGAIYSNNGNKTQHQWQWRELP